MAYWISVTATRPEYETPSGCGHPHPKAKVIVKSVSSSQGQSALSQRRGEVLRGLFPKLASWLETSLGRARRREIEAFLSHATDIADLEERIRKLQRDAHFSRYS